MRNHFRFLSRRVALLVLLLIAVQPSTHAADTKQQRKAKEAEVKRLNSLGRNAEKQGRLLDARKQYLASEDVLFNTDAEKGQVQRAAMEQRPALHGIAFEAIPTEPVSLAFRKELK